MAFSFVAHLFAWRMGRYTKTRKLGRERKNTACLGWKVGIFAQERYPDACAPLSIVLHVEISDSVIHINFFYPVHRSKDCSATPTLLTKLQSAANF